MKHFGLNIILGVAILMNGNGEAAIHKFALILSQNVGGKDDMALRYTNNDAKKMALALRASGGFPDENVMVVTNADRTQFFIQVDRLKKRLKEVEGQRLVALYYSGHADKQNLHMAGTLLSRAELKEVVNHIPADLKVVILDACNSGAFLRLKGGRPALPIRIEFEDQLETTGEVYISSSSVSEYSHESSLYRGSIFTHFLSKGIMGEADVSKDALVTLDEAYQYAYHKTVLATAAKAEAIQHPNFKLNIEGSGQIVLANLQESDATLIFPKGARGRYFVFSDPSDFLVGEFEQEENEDKHLAITEGDYLIERVYRSGRYQGRVSIAKGGKSVVSENQMTSIPNDQSLLKGELHIDKRHRLNGGIGYTRSVLTDDGFHAIYLLSYGLEIKTLEIGARFGYSKGRAELESPITDSDLFLGGVYGLFPLPVAREATGFKLAVGGHADFLWGEETETVLNIPTAQKIYGASLGGIARASFDLNSYLSIWLSLESNAVSINRSGTHSFHFNPLSTIGFMVRW